MERAFEARQLPYVVLSHIVKGPKAGRFVCYENLKMKLGPADILTGRQLSERLSELESSQPNPVLIYKMHGTALHRYEDASIDSLVLTENDYVEFFAQNLLNKIPTRILDLLRTSRLMFLGYALEDWNFRVLLRKLQALQREGDDNLRRHWAFLLDADPVEVKFWEKRGVNLYPVSLDVVLTNLLQKLAEKVA